MTPTEARALANNLGACANTEMTYWPEDHQIIDALRSLADQVEVLQKDAERYRWLRNNSANISWENRKKMVTLSTFGQWIIRGSLDQAIDRAREAT